MAHDRRLHAHRIRAVADRMDELGAIAIDLISMEGEVFQVSLSASWMASRLREEADKLDAP